MNNNSFNEKHKTPMQFLKVELKKLKDLVYLNFIELNGKKSKTHFIGIKTYTSHAVNFDYLILFSLPSSGVYRNEKGDLRHNQSFGFAINYKDREPEIRATLKVDKDSGNEYSKIYTIEDFKNLIIEFNNKIEKLNTFELFKDIFGIKLSSEYSFTEIQAIKKENNDFFKKLKEDAGKLKQKKDNIAIKLSKNKDYGSNERNEIIKKLKNIQNEINELELTKIKHFEKDSKNLPSVIRQFFSNHIKDGKL